MDHVRVDRATPSVGAVVVEIVAVEKIAVASSRVVGLARWSHRVHIGYKRVGSLGLWPQVLTGPSANTVLLRMVGMAWRGTN